MDDVNRNEFILWMIGAFSGTIGFSFWPFTRRNHLHSAFGPGDYARAIRLNHDARAIRQSSDLRHLACAWRLTRLTALGITQRIETRIVRRGKPGRPLV